jgi:hypothetical protein
MVAPPCVRRPVALFFVEREPAARRDTTDQDRTDGAFLNQKSKPSDRSA